ncbi:MAG: site-specific DNA-methyltransferase [Tidjanibacter sp.]|nr:site-specific DNA-methyltransferase [Tidjanibacter sp.]
MIVPFYKSPDRNFTLLKGDCVELLRSFEFKFDMIFADPPYHLSNGGISVQSGRIVCVDKGEWDVSNGFENDYIFDKSWISACRDKLKENGTIWISGTHHNMFSIARCLTELGFKILNCITWVKTNPPPNVSCRYFTHSTEYILWARKEAKTPHFYNYELMKEINGGKQMKDVWLLPTISKWEKLCGKHPTQKPLCLLSRIIQASTKHNAWILDPFSGSSTTGIAANLLGRRFLGIEQVEDFLNISKARKEEILIPEKQDEYIHKIEKQSGLFKEVKQHGVLSDITTEYTIELPF